VTSDPDVVARAERVVLPGVGAFAHCRDGLFAIDGMVEALNAAVKGAGVPFLGICVGMQLMAERGLEFGVHEGLGWIAGEVRAMQTDDPALKIPHMGWNTLNLEVPDHPLFAGIMDQAYAYFVHSYVFEPAHESDILATVDYGGRAVAVIGRDNMAGTQFHPEKSQHTGLTLIGNFLAWQP
jgi:glutamine amidotransferase